MTSPHGQLALIDIAAEAHGTRPGSTRRSRNQLTPSRAGTPPAVNPCCQGEAVAHAREQVDKPLTNENSLVLRQRSH